MISCELFFSIEELSDGLKCVLAERLTIHFRLIRILYMASLISWLCSMFFSSEVVGLKISSQQIHQMSMINHGHHCGSSPFSLYTCGKKRGNYRGTMVLIYPGEVSRALVGFLLLELLWSRGLNRGLCLDAFSDGFFLLQRNAE